MDSALAPGACPAVRSSARPRQAPSRRKKVELPEASVEHAGTPRAAALAHSGAESADGGGDADGRSARPVDGATPAGADVRAVPEPGVRGAVARCAHVRCVARSQVQDVRLAALLWREA